MQEHARAIQRLSDNAKADLSTMVQPSSFCWCTEEPFSDQLWKKFAEIGLVFTRQAAGVRFHENGKCFAVVDFFLENEAYAMLVAITAEQ